MIVKYFLKNIKYIFIIIIILFISYGLYLAKNYSLKNQKSETLKLYWFIPDGLRADPDLFTLYKWAEDGELPNIKKLMDMGAYGYSKPDFPSHTPVNTAVLVTGAHPKTNGVSDGPMRIEGYPLKMVSISGFRSNAKKVPPMWYTLENNKISSLLLSLPGATPPELSQGITIRGRWGGWGADFSSIIFQESGLILPKSDEARASKLFYTGTDLYKKVNSIVASGWENAPRSYSAPKESTLEGWDKKVYAYIYDSSNDQKQNYDRIAFSFDKKKMIIDVPVGKWSDWTPITLKWQTRNDYNSYTPKKLKVERDYTAIDVKTFFRLKLIKMKKDGAFRIRFIYDSLNEYITKPSSVSSKLHAKIGPMVDFVDSYPPQLIYYPEDKDTFLEEAAMSLNWHKKAVSAILKTYNVGAVFHGIYTPNQMLTSRWWMGYLDPKSTRYNDISEVERKKIWSEVKWMYKKIDDIVGEIIKNADKNTIIVLSADHGVAALNKEVYLNNFFAEKGLLKYKIDPITKIPIIDWENTKAIFLRMDSIYINPEGLGGNWTRAKGEDYDVLRDKVISFLGSLKDENGVNPFSSITKWEDAGKKLLLPKDRIGDIVISNKLGYSWDEEVTDGKTLFTVPLKSGYKQAILPKENSVWTPFIIAGPGVKKGFKIKKPINHTDQYPTIMKLLGQKIPDFVDGSVLKNILVK